MSGQLKTPSDPSQPAPIFHDGVQAGLDTNSAAPPLFDMGGDQTKECDISPADHTEDAAAVQRIINEVRNESSVLFRLDHLKEMALKRPVEQKASASLPEDLGLLELTTAPPAPPLLMPTTSGFPRWIVATTLGGLALAVLTAAIVVIIVIGDNSKDRTKTIQAHRGAERSVPVVSLNSETPKQTSTNLPIVAKNKQPPVEKKTNPVQVDLQKPQSLQKEQQKQELQGQQQEASLLAKTLKNLERPKTTTDRRSTRAKKNVRRARGVQGRTRARLQRHKLRPKGARSRRRRSHAPNDDLDALLNAALRAQTTRSPHRPSSADSRLPRSLNRGQIQQGMQSVKQRVTYCYDRYKVPGLAKVRITVGKSGRVLFVRIRGSFAGTATGTCIRKASFSARFPRFKGPNITFIYPFLLSRGSR